MSRTRYQLSQRPFVGSLALALVLIFGSASMTLAQSGTPAVPPGSPATSSALEPVPCSTRYQIAEPFIDGLTLDCSFLSVPAFPGETGSPVLRLHVMRLHAATATPAAEPLILLTGGPGQGAGSLLPLFAPATQERPISYATLLDRQDVILLDQRGTGASEPVLACQGDVSPGLLPPPPASGATPVAASPIATLAGATPAPIVPPTADQTAQFLVSCLRAYQGAGIDLSAFNTENNAADVAALITALGVPQADLYGISYGSFLGERVISRYPSMIRSAVLASVVAPDTDIFVSQIEGFNQVLGDVFGLCAADPECAASNPNPEEDLEKAYQRLASAPATLNVTDPASSQTFAVVTDGTTYLTLLYLAAFGSASYLIPPMITAVAMGDDALISAVAALLVTPTGIASGLLASVYCQDFASDIDLDATLEATGVRPVLIDGFTGSWTSQNLVCDSLALPVAAADADAVQSDVPTLLVSGEFDPITPPENATALIGALPNGREVTINAIGHDPITSSGPCGVQLLSAFLAAPTAELDTACASQLSLDMSPDELQAATPAATPLATPIG